MKKLTSPTSHPIKRLIQNDINFPETRHPSPIHSMLDNQMISEYDLDNIKTILHHMINPWDDFKININNFNIKKQEAKTTVKEQLKKIDLNKEHILFTDGSSIPNQGTSSAAIVN
jgi:hypothetical protein